MRFERDASYTFGKQVVFMICDTIWTEDVYD